MTLTADTPLDRPILRRIGWVDYAKVIAIFLVVMTHTYCNAALSGVINSFIMSAFFFFSGYLFSVERNPDYGRFALKRFRQLVVPYLWINAVAYLAWVLVLRRFGNDADSGLQWHEPLVAVALGIPQGLTHDIPVWSLLCFFVVEVIYYPLRRWTRCGDLTIAVMAFAVAATESMATQSQGVLLPLTLAPSAAALGFYALGHWARTDMKHIMWLTRPSVPLLLLGPVMLAVGFELNTAVDFYVARLGNPLLFLLQSAGGILLVTQLAVFMSGFWGDGALVRFLSRGTLIVCGFHILMFAFIKGVMLFGFGVEPMTLTDGVGHGLLMATAAFALCQPIVWAIGRWAPWLVSK